MSDNRIPQNGGDVEDVPASAETDQDILKEARERYDSCRSYEGDNYRDAKDDLEFLSGGLNQWDPIAAQTRTAQKRPCLTVNNLPTFLHQVTNEQRQNKPAIKVHPVDDDADEETAEVEQGLIRHIEYDSNGSVAMNTAVNSAAAIGFGFLRLVTEYESEDSFDQKIMYKRIRNALSVHIDPLSQEPDGSDMCYCFIDSVEDRAEFKRKYPKADANNTDLIGQDMYRGWFTDKTVLVCEYYRIKKTDDTLCMYVDGSTGWKSEKSDLAVQIGKDGKPMERQSERCVVEWFKITGTDVLDRTEIMCKWIPVFPVYGDEIDIDGKVVRSGIIRNAKDSFKMYNLWMTLATEEVTTRPKTPYIGAVGQFETAKQQWQQANSVPYAFIEYDPVTVDGQIAPPPQRQPMADIPSGMLSMMMHAADNKKATTGLFDSSLGARGNATSGVQERAQQHQGDIANFHYADNLNITARHIGRCLLSMIPHYYDAARTVRILGEDETAEQVKINQPVDQVNPKTNAVETVMHDLTVGTYDVTVSAGPSYSTKRLEAADFMTSAMQAAKDPVTASVVTYLAFKNQDIPGAEEAAKMLKKALPKGIAEPEEGEEPVVDTPQGAMPISQVPALIQQMGQALQNAHAEVQKLEQAGAEAAQMEVALKAKDTEIKERELAIKAREVEVKAYEAETRRLAEQAAAGEKADRVDLDRQTAAAEAMRADTEAVNARANELRARMEADEPPEMQEKIPSLEDIVRLIQESRQQVGGMTITAPSGQTYTVEMR